MTLMQDQGHDANTAKIYIWVITPYIVMLDLNNISYNYCPIHYPRMCNEWPLSKVTSPLWKLSPAVKVIKWLFKQTEHLKKATYRIAGYFCGYKFLRFGHKIDWINFCGFYFCGRRSKRNNFCGSNIGLIKGIFDSIKSRVVWHLYSYKDYKHQTPYKLSGFLLSLWIRLLSIIKYDLRW